MRKRVVIGSLLSAIYICAVGYVAVNVKTIPAKAMLSAPASDAVSLVLRSSNVDKVHIAELSIIDREHQLDVNRELRELEEQMLASEELREMLAQQKQHAQQEFLAAQIKEAQEQADELARMQQVAEEAIYQSGGVDVRTEAIVQIGSNTTVKQGQSGTAGVAIPTTQEPSVPVQTEQRIEDSPYYYGQISAIMVCTCIDCISACPYDGINTEECLVLVDGSIIPGGVKVELIDIKGEYQTRSSGLVSGRNAVVFCKYHDIVVANPKMYPKVMLDISVG